MPASSLSTARPFPGPGTRSSWWTATRRTAPGELAAPLADIVFIQTSERVGGARNDGAMRAKGEIVAFADADCIIPPDWLERIRDDFARHHPDLLYGTVYPKEPGFRHRIALGMANTFAWLGYHTRTLYYSLGCNTVVNRAAFIRAGMYRSMDAGEDIEIALRMKRLGKVLFDPKLRVGFSMRRYQQFGTIRSLYQWLYIVAKGGETSRVLLLPQGIREMRPGFSG